MKKEGAGLLRRRRTFYRIFISYLSNIDIAYDSSRIGKLFSDFKDCGR